MASSDPNIALIEVVAARLGDDLLEQVVFVGGAVAGLLVTDAAMPSIRPTEDVDLIVPVIARADYHAIEEVLRQRGFAPDLRKGAPICRWLIGGVVVDLMPTLEEVLGFSNRWYPLAARTAERFLLPGDKAIHVISAPAFIATKMEAFDGRGQGDFLFSHDLGDLIAVIDGRNELQGECERAPDELKRYLADRVRALLATPDFVDALPGHLPPDQASQDRLPDLMDKLEALVNLSAGPR